MTPAVSVYTCPDLLGEDPRDFPVDMGEQKVPGEVAYAAGFNSQSYFSRSFRDEFGTSPSRYRKEGVAA